MSECFTKSLAMQYTQLVNTWPFFRGLLASVVHIICNGIQLQRPHKYCQCIWLSVTHTYNMLILIDEWLLDPCTSYCFYRLIFSHYCPPLVKPGIILFIHDKHGGSAVIFVLLDPYIIESLLSAMAKFYSQCLKLSS